MRFRALLAALLGLAPLGIEAHAAHSDPAMWVVRDADSTVYLLGTIHVMKPETDWRSAKIEAALKSSGEYWMEANVDDPAVIQTYVLNFGYDRQHPLAEKLKPADYKQLVAVAQRYRLSADRLANMRPWLATMALSQAQIMNLGYDPGQGADVTLQHEAEADGKPIKTFETASEQLGFISGLPEDFAAEMLVSTVKELDRGSQQIDALETAWRKGDAKAIEKIGFADMRKEAPGFYEGFIVKRNTAWVKTIETMMQGSGTAFVAVGAGHLVGPDSVPAKLQADGFKVERY